MRKYAVLLALSIVMIFIFAACGSNGDDVAPYANDIEPSLPYQTAPQIDESEIAEEPQPEEDGIEHRFYNLGVGFSINFPASWEGRYGFYAHDVEYDFGLRQYVEVFHTATRDEGYPGTLFRLGTSPRDIYTEDEPPIMAGGTIILAQSGGITYFVHFPSGIEHSEDPNSAAAAEYLEMVGYWEPGHWDFLVKSFRLME